MAEEPLQSDEIQEHRRVMQLSMFDLFVQEVEHIARRDVLAEDQVAALIYEEWRPNLSKEHRKQIVLLYGIGLGGK